MHRPAHENTALIPRPQSTPAVAVLPLASDSRRPLVPWPWILAAITAFGTYLRFYHLTFPALWNDETLVFWRVCGTYGQMLRPLSTDGFPPLHYSLYWLMGHPVPVEPLVVRSFLGIVVMFLLVGGAMAGMAAAEWSMLRRAYVVTAVVLLLGAVAWAFGPARFFPFPVPQPRTFKLTPFVMRFPVALSGALTIPAMYFLARQMVDRKRSLVAALFTACSAFMLFYSRDAKMYADLWLFECLNIGFLLWWFREGGSTRWLCWIASGCAMVGVHATGYVVVGVSLLIFITYLLTGRRMPVATGLLYSLGVLVIVSGPLMHFLKFGKWIDRVEEKESESGIAWVAWYNGAGSQGGLRDGPELARYGTSAFLNGWEWPRKDYVDRPGAVSSDDPVYGPNTPWNGNHRPEAPIREPLLEGPKTAFEISAALLALGLIRWPSRWGSQRTQSHEPSWRVFLWLGFWIVVVGYGYYCHSIPEFSSPTEWVTDGLDYVTLPRLALIAGAVGVLGSAAWFSGIKLWPAAGRAAIAGAVIAVIFVAMWVMHLILAPIAAAAAADLNPWITVWLPRYLGVIWPAFAIAASVLLLRLPTRPFRIAAVTFLMLVNLGIFGMRMTLGTEPPVDKLAADEWASQDPKSTVRCYNAIGGGDIAVAGTDLSTDYSGKVDGITVAGGRYYMQMLSDRTPMSPRWFDASLGNLPDPKNRYNLRDWESPADVASELRRSPQVKTVILWTRTYPSETWTKPPTSRDGERFRFSPEWRETSEETFVIRIPWEWRERWTWIRREYTKVEPRADTASQGRH